MGFMVYSLLWVMQDFVHQPYEGTSCRSQINLTSEQQVFKARKTLKTQAQSFQNGRFSEVGWHPPDLLPVTASERWASGFRSSGLLWGLRPFGSSLGFRVQGSGFRV